MPASIERGGDCLHGQGNPGDLPRDRRRYFGIRPVYSRQDVRNRSLIQVLGPWMALLRQELRKILSNKGLFCHDLPFIYCSPVLSKN